MKRFLLILFTILVAANHLLSETLEERINNISIPEMQSIVEFLGHDLLEGRAPGTRGGNLAEIYMRSLFKWMNLEPGFNNQYLQPFTLKGFTIKQLNIEANQIPLRHIDDVVGTWVGKEKNVELEGEAIFVGFGITTDLWNWDDYKNVDVKDKFVITRVNDPGMVNEKIFEGKTLTYFGRWIYHIEEAARRGAAGILLIHTDESAGYDWNVVKNSWGGEEVYLESDLQNNLKFRGWIKESSLKRILDSKKINLDKLYKKSRERKFKPVPLGFTVKVKGTCDQREVLNHNVIAEIPGKSTKKIVLSAHIDHHGISSDKKGDNIFNGAIDNGSAVAAMMVTAKILKEFQKDLFYTVVVLACQSEEAGLLGSKYYVKNLPDRDRKHVIANINFESTPVWGKTSDFMAIGGRFSTLEDILKPIVKKQGLDYSYFSMTNQGFFFRSDQFSFARFGIPAIWISAGETDDSGEKKYPQFWKTDYHTVRDEYDPQWPLEGMRQTIQMTLRLIDYMNKTKAIPKWKGKLTFPIES
ncbi:MAG: M28 family peptidase [Candidatus Aminicenantes bacterium]|nr:M28 family peptidase [Candidatus Aminicenantes bacterium]NIM79145.1 M28 family peptidase [Candidatus Aminicenantes bacterium]NIN18430.1 M28 family peptidase [Candidatus Aminicenantes bacterium]NIN42318.1 M28 family peptidase [Candidatus Aminicenantes bacterium]NIN85084.1 M28 family peptidase [Candidatus Aminicenantes bacterium]